MTGLQRWRQFVESFILIGFVWKAVATVVGLFSLMMGGGFPSAQNLIPVMGTLGLFAIIIWAIRDARYQGCSRHTERASTNKD